MNSPQTMSLVEKHDFHKYSPEYPELDKLCFLSKNLYNVGLYTVRQYFFQNHKHLSYGDVSRNFANINQIDFRALPAKVAQQTLKLIDQNFKSFFALMKLKSKGQYQNKVKIPQYLDKINGRQTVYYTNQAISTKAKSGYVKLSGTNIFLKSKIKHIQFVRIVHKKYKITVEIGYYKILRKPIVKQPKYAAIDIGLDNLAAVTFSDAKPFIINGKPIKAINQFYNKLNAKLASYQHSDQPKRTKRLDTLSRKRNNKLADYLHKTSRYIVNQLVSQNISDLIVGHNTGWKQGINIGKRNNQNFVSVPFNTLIHMLTYKSALVGISVHIVDESYTSKASFLDRDYIPTYEPGKSVNYKFSGKRKHRGLYVTNTQKINADINGSINIMRKYFQNTDETEPKYVDSVIKSSPKVYTIG